ncbi:basic leucine zipper 19-like isoform X2 [Aristolochia californica]|uniref:basic leucine zipper 19-like isoform X2 n=1 Tax=Aristolochia californica TaxID=171875 RepID=UPI0035D945E9
MDDGELDFSNQEVFSSPNMGDQFPSSCSMDSFFDEILKDTHACTHTHTCNPPGPDLSHTHTCFHVHTKILSGSPEDKVNADETAESTEKCPKKRPLGNREAVRKYREKKKARAASLEDEVARLRAINQQLVKRLQAQPALEAEIARLKCLLVDIRGRIEGELGSFPYQKVGKGGDGAMNSMHSPNISGGGLRGPGFGVCDISNVHCTGNLTAGLELAGCGSGNVASAGIPSSTSANAPAEG